MSSSAVTAKPSMSTQNRRERREVGHNELRIGRPHDVRRPRGSRWMMVHKSPLVWWTFQRRDVSAGAAPHLLRGLDDEPQLGDLLLVCQGVALERRGEAALRRQAELVDVARNGPPPRSGASARPWSRARPSCSSRGRARPACPCGTKRSGSKPPERSSSYSMKKPSTLSSLNSASATKS